MDGTIVLIGCWALSLVLGGFVMENVGWRNGRKLGQREGFQKYAKQLRFERREQALIEPTGQPHARSPKGKARVSEAHFSQPRRNWSPE